MARCFRWIRRAAVSIGASAALVAPLAVACGSDEPSVGERIEGAADEAAEQMEEAGEQASEKWEEAEEEVRDEIDDRTTSP